MSTSAAVFRPRAKPSGIGCWTLGLPSSASLSKSQFPKHPSCSVPSCLRRALSLHPCHFHHRPAALSPSQGIPPTCIPGHPPDLSLLGSLQRGIIHLAPPCHLQTGPRISRRVSICKLLLPLCKQPWPPSSAWFIQAPATPKLCMGVGHQQRLSRGRGQVLKAEIRARGCGPAPFPKVFTGKSRHLRLLRQKSGAKTSGQPELSLQMPSCSLWAPAGLRSLR